MEGELLPTLDYRFPLFYVILHAEERAFLEVFQGTVIAYSRSILRSRILQLLQKLNDIFGVDKHHIFGKLAPQLLVVLPHELVEVQCELIEGWNSSFYHRK